MGIPAASECRPEWEQSRRFLVDSLVQADEPDFMSVNRTHHLARKGKGNIPVINARKAAADRVTNAKDTV